jgi:hypothetical protein
MRISVRKLELSRRVWRAAAGAQKCGCSVFEADSAAERAGRWRRGEKRAKMASGDGGGLCLSKLGQGEHAQSRETALAKAAVRSTSHR